MAPLAPVEEKPILHWGEMGTRWGIKRAVAQIHVLLILSEKPLNTEEIQQSPAAARSNASGSLKEPRSWGTALTEFIKASDKILKAPGFGS